MTYGHHFFSRRREGSGFSPRIRILKVAIILGACILSLRLFNLQVMSYEDYRAAAEGGHTLFKKLFPKRGEIFVRDFHSEEDNAFLVDIAGEKLYPAVTNREYRRVYAVPRDVREKELAAERLAPLLEMQKEEIIERLGGEGSYRVLKRKVPEETYEKIAQLGLPGIGSESETYRFYPEKGLGGHVFGFLGYAQDVYRGVYGIEGYFHEILKGTEGSLRFERDAIGTLIPVGDSRVVDAVDGSNIVLTLDRTVQMVACDRLKKWVARHGADGGTVIIMNPKTGGILAMCSVPDFDPETYWESDVATYPNPAIFAPYEPGSTFKAITMAIGLDKGSITPESVYEDTGRMTIDGYAISNSDKKAYGKQTMVDVLEKSLNTGVIHVAKLVGLEEFRRYVQDFGFGAPSGIELDTEARGNIKSLNEKREIYLATNSFGQGLTVTPLQLVTAYAALANGGALMQPYIVDMIIKPNGEKEKTSPRVVRQVISRQTSTLVSGMLANVVQRGHGKRAGVPGYYVAGKTGTAQVPKKDGRGYETDATIGSFVGYAPVDDPAFVMLVKIDRPRDVQWAESSAAPLFGEIAKFLLDYYEIPPDDRG